MKLKFDHNYIGTEGMKYLAQYLENINKYLINFEMDFRYFKNLY